MSLPVQLSRKAATALTRKLLYTGTSMNPLMREGDILYLRPYGGEKIHPGDVVAFSHPGRPGTVIHRVSTAGPWGLRTKGDNTPALDDWLLQPADILGRVVAIQRQGRTLPVPRRVPASLYLLKARHWLDGTVSRLLHPVYHRLARSGWFQGRLAAWMKPELIYLPRADGPEWQLWLGKMLIGRKIPHQPCWTIRRPFRLFVDEASLPRQAPESAQEFPD
jgi:signal peptidase I